MSGIVRSAQVIVDGGDVIVSVLKLCILLDQPSRNLLRGWIGGQKVVLRCWIIHELLQSSEMEGLR